MHDLGYFWPKDTGISKNFRKQIYINDNPTIEVDYKGLHAAILSARKGVVSDTDRYDLGLRILTDCLNDIIKGFLQRIWGRLRHSSLVTKLSAW